MRAHDGLVRRINACVAAALAAFFLVHALAGALSRLCANASAPSVLVYLFVGAVPVHILLSQLTSWLMLTDDVRPPSAKKRQHQWLKWGSGVVLAIAATVHIFFGTANPIWLYAVVAAALAWHSVVGVKSMVRDLKLPRSLRQPLRAAIIGCAALAGLLLAASCL